MKTIIITLSGECENHFPEWLQEATNKAHQKYFDGLYE